MAPAGPQVYSTTVEVDTHHNAVAKRSIANTGLSSHIDVLLGHGTKALAKLEPEIAAGQRKLFDWVFIDADKQNDLACLQMVLEMPEPATTFFVDDVVRNGKLADRKAAKKDDRVRATREQVEAIGKDERVKAVVVQAVSQKNYDGFSMVVKKCLNGRYLAFRATVGVLIHLWSTSATSTVLKLSSLSVARNVAKRDIP